MMVTLAMKPWMYKFAAREYGNPYIMDLSQPFSQLLHAHLGKSKECDIKAEDFKTYTHKFRIRIPTRCYEREGLVGIKRNKQKILRKFIEKKFFDNLVHYVYARQEIKNTYPDIKQLQTEIAVRKSISMFLSGYNITDNEYEISHIERRYRMHLNNKALTILGDEHKAVV